MSESQDRGGFEAPRAGLRGVTGPAAAALSAVAGAREKPAVIASYRGATPDAAVVAGWRSRPANRSTRPRSPPGRSASAPRLPRTSRPGPTRKRCATGSSSKPSSSCRRRAPGCAEAEAAAAADYRRAARADNTRRAYRAGVAAFTEWCACIPATTSRLPVSAELARASRSPTH